MLCATNVRTGRRRIFDTRDVSLDAVLASACLPFVFPAVEIDGEPYWDGGYTGNPAIAPFLREGCVNDLIIIGINPLVRDETPRHARDIINRVNEISFNSTFWLELTAIAVIIDMVDEGLIDAAQASMDLLIESLPNRDDGGPSACIQSDRPLASGRKAPTI